MERVRGTHKIFSNIDVSGAYFCRSAENTAFTALEQQLSALDTTLVSVTTHLTRNNIIPLCGIFILADRRGDTLAGTGHNAHPASTDRFESARQ